MTLESYQLKITEQREVEILNENLVEVFKFYVLFSDIESLSFFEFDYELNRFKYKYNVNSKDSYIDDTQETMMLEAAYSVIIEENETIYGMITFETNPGSSPIAKELLTKMITILKKRSKLEKEILFQDSVLDIYLITDNDSENFTKKLNTSLNAIINAKIDIKQTISDIEESLKNKTQKSIVIYVVENIELLKQDHSILETLNEIIIVIGPNNYDLSLYCGQLEINKYISKDDFNVDIVKKVIIEYRETLHNKYENQNQIIALSGISGGIGTTTTAMNVANIIALKNPNKNILYIDLCKTKAISNLFLSKNPLPKKTLIDLINSNEFEIEKNLENGLEKIRENFYAINGIQKHIDSEYLEQDQFINKLLEYISVINSKYNYIIIDVGQADASKINSTIYDISNELWILTEMSLPHISKLKTFFSLMKRAGLKDKLSFIVNRYDSVNAISVSDVISILNTSNEDQLMLTFKLPNDYESLGYSWNYCELVSDKNAKSPYVKTLKKILIDKKLIDKDIDNKKSSVNIFSKFFGGTK